MESNQNEKKKEKSDGRRNTKIRVNTEIDGIANETSTFKGYHDFELKYQSWRNSDSKSNAVLVLVHGLGDHSGHMMTVVQYFVKTGLVVYGYDQRGHGDSGGSRGHISKWVELTDDLHCFCKMVYEKEKLPLILFGNSMGGEVVLDYMMRTKNSNVIGVITNAPALSLQDLNSVTSFFVKILSKVSPTSASEAPLDSSKLTRDPEKQKENDDDILVHTTVSFQLLNEMQSTAKWIKSHPKELQCPVLLLQGKNDPVVHSKVNINFFQQAQATNKTITIYATEGGKHETFNDTDREQVLKQCESFITSLLTSKGPTL